LLLCLCKEAARLEACQKMYAASLSAACPGIGISLANRVLPQQSAMPVIWLLCFSSFRNVRSGGLQVNCPRVR
jgi:hypothetical protein